MRLEGLTRSSVWGVTVCELNKVCLGALAFPDLVKSLPALPEVEDAVEQLIKAGPGFWRAFLGHCSPVEASAIPAISPGFSQQCRFVFPKPSSAPGSSFLAKDP